MAPTLLDASSPLRQLRRQLRLLRKQLVVLMPKNDYYVQTECIAALRALGHRVVEVVLGQAGEVEDVGVCLGRMMRACVEHRPDMLLTINYTGFDRAAWFDEIVEAMGLPVAVWFVDSPFFLAVGYLPPAPSVTSFFCWDASYVQVLRAHGAPRVFHLPLATDPSLFAGEKTAAPKPTMPLAFVGHTLDTLVDLWRAREEAECAASSDFAAAASAEAWALTLATDRHRLHSLVPVVQPPYDPQIVRLAHANYLASRARRCQLLAALPQRQLHLFGNEAWRRHLPGATYHPGTGYGREAAAVYRSCAVNINITNLQMPSTVNQRVFDVPAAGGFLLTDCQPELVDLLTPGEEIVTFASADELRDKAAFYSRQPAARAQIVQAGKKRVLAEHTYVHRMASLLATMRSQHGPGVRGPQK